MGIITSILGGTFKGGKYAIDKINEAEYRVLPYIIFPLNMLVGENSLDKLIALGGLGYHMAENTFEVVPENRIARGARWALFGYYAGNVILNYATGHGSCFGPIPCGDTITDGLMALEFGLEIAQDRRQMKRANRGQGNGNDSDGGRTYTYNTDE